MRINRHFSASHQSRQESKKGLCTAVENWIATRGRVFNDMAGDSSQRNLVVRFRGIGSRSGAPAEAGSRWEANYKLKLRQDLGTRVPNGAAGGRELRRGENKECCAGFGSMMMGALVQVCRISCSHDDLLTVAHHSASSKSQQTRRSNPPGLQRTPSLLAMGLVGPHPALPCCSSQQSWHGFCCPARTYCALRRAGSI